MATRIGHGNQAEKRMATTERCRLRNACRSRIPVKWRTVPAGALVVALLILAELACAQAEFKCPAGTTRVGAGPPVGRQLFCQRSVGDRHGPTVAWHANGQKSFQVDYVDGRPLGPITAWWENGKAAVTGYTWPDNGWLVMWDEDGHMRAEVEIRNRQLLIKAWDENGGEERYDESRLFSRNQDLPLVIMLFGMGIGIE